MLFFEMLFNRMSFRIMRSSVMNMVSYVGLEGMEPETRIRIFGYTDVPHILLFQIIITSSCEKKCPKIVQKIHRINFILTTFSNFILAPSVYCKIYTPASAKMDSATFLLPWVASTTLSYSPVAWDPNINIRVGCRMKRQRQSKPIMFPLCIKSQHTGSL